MALFVRSTLASMDLNQAHQILAGLIAGEALDIVAPCYIKSSDSLVYMATGAAANEAAEVAGFTPRAVVIGQPVTLFGPGSRFKYSDSLLTPGDILYLGATAGRLDPAATTGDAFGYAVAVTATDIVIMRVFVPKLTSATVGAGTIGETELADLGVTQAKLAVGAAGAGLTGLVAKFVADVNVIGGIPVVHRIAIADAVADTTLVLTHKTQILDIWFRNLGVAAHATTDTIAAAQTAGSIFAATPKTAAVGAVIRPAALVPANLLVAAGATVTISAAKGGGALNVAVEVVILGVRSA
jgi:hypothetical protein